MSDRTPQRRIEFTVSHEVGDAYDKARGDVKMATWIKRALESVLDGGAETGTLQPPPAPTRTSGSHPDVERERTAQRTAASSSATSANLARQEKLNKAKAGKR